MLAIDILYREGTPRKKKPYQYDAVWRTEMIYALHWVRLRNNFTNFIQSFLPNRKFSVSGENLIFQARKPNGRCPTRQRTYCNMLQTCCKLHHWTTKQRRSLYIEGEIISLYFFLQVKNISEKLIQNTINKLENRIKKERGIKFSQKRAFVTFNKLKKVLIQI